MKHKNSLILICCTAGLALIAIVLMSCFGGSSHNEPLPSCSSIHTEKEDCPILDINLRYNLNNLYNKAKDFGIQNDLIELEVAHPGFYANQFQGPLTISIRFSDLLTTSRTTVQTSCHPLNSLFRQPTVPKSYCCALTESLSSMIT